MPAVLPMASFLITWAQEIKADLESQEAGSVNKVFAMQVWKAKLNFPDRTEKKNRHYGKCL